MSDQHLGESRHALSLVPSALFLMTAQHEGTRAGVLVRAVQVCAHEPLLLSVALRKGHPVDPLLRDSRCFALCRVSEEDRLVTRKFHHEVSIPSSEPEDESAPPSDPFDCMPVEVLATGAPVIRRCSVAFDCEVVRHIDIEPDHELFIGAVRATRVYDGAAGAGRVTPPSFPPGVAPVNGDDDPE
jgi:flavin reductase (DIM6/NTAB) family NADH-FMN oxidoreductase RutF